MLKYKKARTWIVAAALLLCVAVAVLFMTSPKDKVQVNEAYDENAYDENEGDEIPYDKSVYVVNTYPATAIEDIEKCFDQGKECIQTTYYEMSDGTWATDTHQYLYRLELSGVLNMAEKESTYVILSNTKDITFDQAWKASGLSSNMDDYFDIEESLIVGTILREKSENSMLLYEAPEKGKVSIQVQPSGYRERLSYFYIPTGDAQTWLLEQMSNLEMEKIPHKKSWQEQRETGWELVYNDIWFRAFEGGYLYATMIEESGIYEILLEIPELCSYVETLLVEELNYTSSDPKQIKDIVSARLDIAVSVRTGGEFYSQTITEQDKLEQLESWFSNAKYLSGGVDCGNQYAGLELTLANGEVITMSMATDSCPNFGINGVYYDYRPTPSWDNREFYQLFDEIPWQE